MDREKVIKGLQNLRDAIANDFIHEVDQAVGTIDDALSMLKEQEAVKPQDAEMLIIRNGGAEEYVKDIESIVLLAHKDYDIVYCGTFGRSVK